MKNVLGKKTIYYFIVKYKNDNKERLKILDNKFIKKNRNKSKIIYNNKTHELKEYFEDIDKNYNRKSIIKYKLIFIHNIIDFSYMFYHCDSLISISNNNETNLNISNSQIYIINMHGMFYRCNSLITLLDISKWNISNIDCMHGLFYRCIH